jgi:hypothetical protein
VVEAGNVWALAAPTNRPRKTTVPSASKAMQINSFVMDMPVFILTLP